MKRNIVLFYFFQIIGSFEFIQPFFILFLLSKGLNFTQAMVLQSIFALTILLLEIPSGAFADRYGRARSIQISSFIMASSFLLYTIAESFWFLLFIEIVFATGYVFFSGADSAFLYDTLKGIKKQKDYDKVQSNSIILNRMFYGISGFISGFLVFLGYDFLLYLTAGFYFAAFIITLFFVEPRHFEDVIEKNYFSHIKDSVMHSFTNRKLRFIIIYSATIGSLFYISYFLLQPYLKSANIQESYFGVFYLLFFSIVSIGYYFAPKIKISRKKIIGFVPLSIGILFLCAYLFFGKFSIIFILLSLIPGAFINITSLVIINENTPSSIRATTISVQSFLSSLIFAILAPLAGLITDETSPSLVFIFLSVPLFLFSIYYIFIKKDIKDKPLELKDGHR